MNLIRNDKAPIIADVFISHASEDKDSFVRGLAESLSRISVSLFYDEFSLKAGDSLVESINMGLARSTHVILVLSNNFFNKSWTNKEFNAAFSRYIGGRSKIIPIYLGVSNDVVSERYPLMADILGINGALPLNDIINKICESIEYNPIPKYVSLGDLSGLCNKIKTDGMTILLSRIKLLDSTIAVKRQTILSIGIKDVNCNSISFEVINNKVLTVIIADSCGKLYGLTSDVEPLIATGFSVGLTIDVKNHKIIFYVNGKIINECNLSNDFGFDNSAGEISGSIGADINGLEPARSLICGYSISACLDQERFIKIHDAFMSFLEQSGKQGIGFNYYRDK